MTLWRLELHRLVRTHRWAILFGVYLFFGVLGPFSAAYMNEIITRFAGDVQMTFPDPRPVDGIIQFVGNASQLGLLAVVIVAAGALALDSHPEIAAFFRTRTERARTLLVPRYAVMTLAAVAALVVGTAVAWALTEALIGGLPAGALAIGTLYGGLYLAFAIAVLAAVLGLTRSNVAAVFGAFAVLIALPVIGLVPTIKPWLPSELFAAVIAVIEGVPATDFVRSAIVTVAATAGLLVFAAYRYERREV
jgi:ABC-2 type transport system permease protein